MAKTKLGIQFNLLGLADAAEQQRVALEEFTRKYLDDNTELGQAHSFLVACRDAAKFAADALAKLPDRSPAPVEDDGRE